MGIFRGSTLSGDALANIDIVADNIDNVNTVGTNIASVNTVAGDIGDVTTVAGIAADVGVVASIATEITSVDANETNITTVAGIDSDVTTVAGISSNVTTVAGMSANISSIIANETNINLVAADIADVAIVAEDIADVIAVAAIDSDVTTVAGIDSDVTTVAGIAPAVSNVSSISTAVSNVNSNATNINTVAGISSNVTTVAGIAANVTTVAGISANVTSVASNSTNINTVATNIANVNSVGTNIANVNSVAGNAANINTVAGNNSNITTVAGISGNVTTVATNNANVTTVATNIASVNTNATNIANINQNAANITAIQNASTNATNAAASATAAASSATSAATSAAQASAVALGNEPVRHSVRPSLLLDFANTKTLDPRITFTRGSTATFYDGKTVAKAEENLILYSQECDNASWSKTNSSVTANTEVAPDGTTTADTLTDNATNSIHALGSSGQTFVAGVSYAFSIYAKAGTASWIQLLQDSVPFPSNTFANFDLTNGVVGTTGAGVSSATITSVGNGWYRCSIIATSDAGGGLYRSLVYMTNNTDSGITPSYSGSSQTVYLWGAQLEQRSSVTAYTATTTAPITNYIPALQAAASGVARFEHNPVTGESLGLEIEEQRTNLLLQSEDFGTTWSATRASISANAIVAPNGTLTGDKLVEDTTATNTHLVSQGVTTTAVAHTFSVYAKAAERLRILLANNTVANAFAIFDLSSGTISTTGSATTSSITPVGNGWYRCAITITCTAASNSFHIRLAVESGSTYTGDGYSGIYIWGAQLEAGAFATSYIPTTSATVTRSADSASMTGTNFSSWYRADEGTVYQEASTFNTLGVAFGLSIHNSFPGTNRIDLAFNGSATAGSRGARFTVSFNGTTQADIVQGVTPTAGQFYKQSGVYKVNDFALYKDASSLGTDTVGNVPDPTSLSLSIGSRLSDVYLNGTIKKLAYYAKRLTNSEIQSLTTI